MYLSRILSALFILFLIFPSFSQDILWEKSYGGLHSDYLYDAQPTADYGFILAGSSLSDKSGNKTEGKIKGLDFWVWKMDEHGDLDWQKGFGGQGIDLLKSIQGTLDGGFILGGTSTSGKGDNKKYASRGKEDLWIIKLNAKGDEEWQRTLGGTGRDVMQSISQTEDGGYIIGGSTGSRPVSQTDAGSEKKSPHYGNMDYWVIKLDQSGDVEWERTYGGTYSDILESIQQTKDGGYIVGGHSNSPRSGNKSEDNNTEGDYWVLKLDKKGDIEWQRTLGGDGDDHLYKIIQTADGGFLAGGNSNSGISARKSVSNGKGTDFWVLKLAESGDILWQETYDFGKVDILTSLIENADGTVLIGGHAQSETIGLKRSDPKGVNDYIALKISGEGEELWRKSVGSSGRDVLRKLIETRDGGYLLAGTSNGKASRDKNTGQGRNDFWVVKLKDKEKEDKTRHPGLEAIPNPSQGYTNIIINHEFDTGSATVYDIAGRQLQHFEVKGRTVPVDLRAYPVGIYLINITTNVKTESVKVIRGTKE